MNNPSSAARLRVRGLGHEFVRTRVLDDIHFELAAGELCALVGPSGCGKTTLLHLCNGLLDVQDGVIDNDFASQASMFQQPRLLPWQSTLDNIALGLKAAGVARRERQQRARALALRLGLAASDMDKWLFAFKGVADF